MGAASESIPSKLKHDAIVEALLEIRFDTVRIPEVFFGRLADYDSWKGFEQRRLPAYEVPPVLRQVDPNLRFRPVFELLDRTGHRAVRAGAQVLSYHQLEPYVGWEVFEPQLNDVVQALFAKSGGVTVKRLGLRYLNALRSDLHGISSISNLNMKVEIAETPVSGGVNVNVLNRISDDSDCTVRIATPEFAQGNIPQNTSVVVDVDVYTREGFSTRDPGQVSGWLAFAHTQEKIHFFRLLTASSIAALRED